MNASSQSQFFGFTTLNKAIIKSFDDSAIADLVDWVEGRRRNSGFPQGNPT
jgi:hypothetical protein